MTRICLTYRNRASLAVVLMLLLGSLPSVSNAAPARSPITKPVSKDFVKLQQKKSITRTKRNLKRVTERLEGMKALIRDLQQRNVTDLMADRQVEARMAALQGQQRKLKGKLSTLKEQSVMQYAASRGIPVIPAPPTSAPPPLPPNATVGLLTVATPQNAPAAKSHRPPGGVTKVTIDPGI